MPVRRLKSGLPLSANWEGRQRLEAHTKRPATSIAFVYLAAMIISWAGNWPLMKLALDQAQRRVNRPLRQLEGTRCGAESPGSPPMR